ncbi:hypothetical protein M3P05_05175 [Sansalvadorimonas sp. 2012CJ34-2]|uniref:Uncharacterized protein n=1 Tax=Parendozoicomonas callyspongiae TaxID=2942213 RepID=A0ABT0PE64_9GAMM|nr:hypothetical protein [Sansalvadorimonas sp. 2012CJ34-2]MCL6269336.1 hypothetical protein [Sansalvadorimonas sp. 2012CJ34-2]
MTIANQQLVRLIASDQGRTLYATPAAKAAFDALETRGQTNYWANLIVREIKRLRCSKFSSDYVYISTARSQGDEAFRMNLPGCCVTVHPLSYYGSMDNSYVVTDIQVDNSYQKERKKNQMPQLYEAVEGRSDWKTSERAPANVLNTSMHANNWVLVGINGTGGEINQAAAVVANHIDNVKQVGKGRVAEVGYNFFFTPSRGYFQGLRALKAALKPESSSSKREAAILLADVMRASTKEKDLKVRWITQKSGSAILTQAMRILRDQGVRLGENHSLFLSSPTSSLNSAYNLSQNLGMKVETEFYNSNPSNIVEQLGSQWGGVGSATNAYKRTRNSEDGFGFWDGVSQVYDSYGGTKGLVSAASATAGVLAFLGTGPAGVVAAMATAAGEASLAGAATQVTGAALTAGSAFGLAVNNSPVAKGYHQSATGHLKNMITREFA